MASVKPLSLDRVTRRGANRLDVIRFVAAVLVIYAHCFPLADGTAPDFREPLESLFGYDMGSLGVAIFFVISGFLVTASIEHSKSIITYSKARLLRIYPALIVLVVFTVLALGPLFAKTSASIYFAHPDTWAYFRVLLLYKTSYFLPGVFTNNAYPYAINGSLWTLIFEMGFYALVMIVFLVRSINCVVAALLFFSVYFARLVLLGVYPLSGHNIPVVGQLSQLLQTEEVFYGTRLLMFFLAGMMFYTLRLRVPVRPWIFLTCLLLLIPLRLMNASEYWVAFPGVYCLLCVAIVPGRLMHFSRYGDFSYGLYIYAFPVQQGVTALAGGRMEPLFNFAISLPVTLGLAALSWHVVERPALALKNVRLVDVFRRDNQSRAHT